MTKAIPLSELLSKILFKHNTHAYKFTNSQIIHFLNTSIEYNQTRHLNLKTSQSQNQINGSVKRIEMIKTTIHAYFNQETACQNYEHLY